MYSVVLMLAMTSGTELPAWGRGCGGCRGGYSCSGCCGGYGYGGCSGGYGCSGCYGSRGCSGSWGCSGCAGGMAYTSGCYGCYGVQPVAPVMVNTMPRETPNVMVQGSAPATIVVSLPAGATLTIDDTPTSSTAARRVFQTPLLKQGYEYYYTLKAQAMQDGQEVQVTNQITVRPGQTTTVRLEFPVASVARQ